MVSIVGCPGGASGKESACQCRRYRFDPWVRKIPWRRAWQPTQVFLPGESHGQRSLVGYGAWCCKKSDTTERLSTQCMILQLCEYTKKNSELYTKWWVISQYSFFFFFKVQVGASDTAKFMKRVQKCPKHGETLNWTLLFLRRSPVPLWRHTFCSCFLFISRGVIHSHKQINSIWSKPVAVLLSPIKNIRAKYRLASERRGRDNDGC